jgi:hypothetical protein
VSQWMGYLQMGKGEVAKERGYDGFVCYFSQN